MAQISIEAQPRNDFGKGASRRLRRAGLVPGVIYGGNTKLVHVSFDAGDLAKALKKSEGVIQVTGAGNGVMVKPREVQKDPVTQAIEHIDLIVVNA